MLGRHASCRDIRRHALFIGWDHFFITSQANHLKVYTKRGRAAWEIIVNRASGLKLILRRSKRNNMLRNVPLCNLNGRSPQSVIGKAYRSVVTVHNFSLQVRISRTSRELRNSPCTTTMTSHQAHGEGTIYQHKNWNVSIQGLSRQQFQDEEATSAAPAAARETHYIFWLQIPYGSCRKGAEQKCWRRPCMTIKQVRHNKWDQ